MDSEPVLFDASTRSVDFVVCSSLSVADPEDQLSVRYRRYTAN